MKSSKPSFFKASRYLLIALPLLFLAPITFTIGLKALKLDGKYALLILGSLLALAAIIITAVGVIKLTNYIFDRDK
ncbi:MAG: DUF6095 family protein [Flavobacteriaceae bacterium]|jgi:hypothetical protein|nr:hypothetical protein [Flavobacteriaceae bacterium]MCB0485248.1 hypothetical protein [Flavobacteriaceae bacterium]